VSLLEFRARLRYASGFVLDAAFQSDAAVTALFGPSGSGKTSILSIIAGLRQPEEGLVRLSSRLLFDSAQQISLPAEARRVGYVFQDYLLFPHLNVRGNLLYGWRRRGREARPVDLAAVTRVLELDGLLDRLPHTLSGGQRQRVAIGRALLCGPDILLLDEPLAGTEEALRERVLEYVSRIVQSWGIPTVYVTHDPAAVRQLAQHVVVLEHGRVVRQGPPANALEIKNLTAEPSTRALP
jgi:molybdate transport system ATP-binding protein